MRTQQHNLLPAIPVSISPFQIQDRGGGAVCVCVGENVSETEGCVCVGGERGVAPPPPPTAVLSHHAVLLATCIQPAGYCAF